MWVKLEDELLIAMLEAMPKPWPSAAVFAWLVYCARCCDPAGHKLESKPAVYWVPAGADKKVRAQAQRCRFPGRAALASVAGVGVGTAQRWLREYRKDWHVNTTHSGTHSGASRAGEREPAFNGRNGRDCSRIERERELTTTRGRGPNLAIVRRRNLAIYDHASAWYRLHQIYRRSGYADPDRYADADELNGLIRDAVAEAGGWPACRDLIGGSNSQTPPAEWRQAWRRANGRT